jgi:hypothetical protein
MKRKVCAAAAVALLATCAGAASAAVPNPKVQGPVSGGVRGYPWNHALFALRGPGYDYTEREFLFGGRATDLSSGQSAPYTSRMLVRLPRNPAGFSGTVLVEWLNVTAQADLETAWPVEAQYLMRHGIGYIGVSAQLAGVCCGPTTLKGWDPVRYAKLLHPSDTFAKDIFSQSIEALRDPAHNVPGPAGRVDPLGGMQADHVVVTGASQSASQLTGFINGGYPRGAVDLFVITRGGGPFNDFSAPIFQLNEENNRAPQPDNANYVAWEEAGAAHAPAVWSHDYIWPELRRDLARNAALPDPIDLGCSINRAPVDYSSRALSHWVERYFDTGELAPPAPRVQRDAAGNIVRDADGLAKGGLRHVFVEVPVAFNTSEGCTLYGNYRPWTAAKIRSRYATHADYVAKVAAWADHEVDLGWLLPEDRDDVVAKAQAFTAPWLHGSCYDTANETGDEDGLVSKPIGTLSHRAKLPLGTGPVLHEINCDVVVPLGL